MPYQSLKGSIQDEAPKFPQIFGQKKRAFAPLAATKLAASDKDDTESIDLTAVEEALADEGAEEEELDDIIGELDNVSELDEV